MKNYIRHHPRARLPILLLLCLRGTTAVTWAQDGVVSIELAAPVYYLDSASPSGKCVAASILKDQGMLFAAESPDLSPGVYRAHLRLRAAPTISKHTSRLAFSVGYGENEVSSKRALSIVDFELPGVYQEFTVPLEIRKKKSHAVLSVSWQWEGGALQKRPPEPVKPPPVSTDATLDEVKDQDEPLEHDLRELPFHVATDRVWLEPLGDAAIRELSVDKIRYAPGEQAEVSGVVINYSPAARNLELAASLVRGLDDVETANRREIAVPAAGSAPFHFRVPLGDRMWGCEIRCVLREKDREIGAASQYFTVHNNPWAVAIGSIPMDLTIYRAGPECRGAGREATLRKNLYGNQVEFVFWAPDDFGDLNPEGIYWSGQMRRYNSAGSTKALIDAFHKAGIACAFYAKLCTAGGKAGYEVLRQHPEWLVPAFYDVAQLDRWDRSTGMSIWPQLAVRSDIPEPFLHHADEIIRSVKTFGWDMVRYDSSMTRPESGDILRLVKYRVNQACPGFQWGYNDDVHRTDRPPPPTLNRWRLPDVPGWDEFPAKPVYDLLCENGGLIMDEYNKHAQMEQWTYDRYASRHISAREQVHQRGGHLLFCPFEAEMASDALYQEVIPMAARSHRGWDAAKGRRVVADYDRFATRYAEYVWDNRCVRLPNADKVIDWGGSADALFKWSSYAYLRRVTPQRPELILQMVNMPPERVCAYDDCRVPPPRTDVGCSIRIPQGVTVRDVWCTTAEPDIKQSTLPFQAEGGRLAFTVPKLRFWNMLVIRMEGEGEW